MDPFIVGILGMVLLFVLLALKVHVGVAMGLIGVGGLIIILGLPATVSTVTTGAFYFATNVEFIVLPLFVLMGLVAMYGGISTGAFDALSKWVGRLPGGLGIAAVAGCTVFGTLCGSSLVTASVFAKVSCPEMRRHGYEKRFSYGIVSTAGIIGMLIPPSMLAVVYGLLTSESIGALLIAGIGPGVLLAVLYCVAIIFMAWFKPQLAPRRSDVSFTWKERIVSLKSLWPVIVSFLVVIGGIYGGIFTVAEAGAWGTLAIIIIAFLNREMKWKQLWAALGETMSIMGMIFLTMIAAKVLARFMVVSGIGQYLMSAIVGMNLEIWQLMLGMMVVYLILGCFLDSVSMLSITLPILYPVVEVSGIDPMWFAMVVIMSLEAGLVTPPVGLNVYAVKSVAEEDVSLGDIFMGVLPFLLMTVIGIAIVVLVPEIATWLPQNMLQ